MITFTEFRSLVENISQFVIYRSSNRQRLATASGFDAAKKKASDVRRSLGLSFDEVKFMTAKRFSGGSSNRPRIERSPVYNASKRTYFKMKMYPDGSTADID